MKTPHPGTRSVHPFRLQATFVMAMVIAGLLVLGATGPARASVIWDGEADTKWKTNNNWKGNSKPGAGDDVVLPDNGALPSHSLTMDIADTFASVLMAGATDYTLALTENLKMTGVFGSTGAGELYITGGKDIEANDVKGTIHLGNTGKKLKFTDNLNNTTIGDGGAVHLGSGVKLETKANMDTSNLMDYSLIVAGGVTTGAVKADVGDSGTNHGLVHWDDVQLGNGSTLVLDMKKNTDMRLDLDLAGSATIDAKSDPGKNNGALSALLFIGDVTATAATASLTADVEQKNGSTTSARFIGLLSPGMSPGVLNVNTTTNAGGSQMYIASTAKYVWELSDTGSDVINVTGDLIVEDGFDLELTMLDGAANGTYDLFTYTGSFDGDLEEWDVTNPDGLVVGTPVLSDTGSAIQVTLEVPEPGTMILLAVGGVGMLLRRRRRA